MSTVTILFSDNPRVQRQVSITPLTTIGELKQLIRPHIGGYPLNSNLKFSFGNSTELNSVVFNTNNYDNVNFQQYANVLNGSKIVLSAPVPVQKPKIYILLNLDRDFEYASLDLSKVLKYFTDNYIGLTGASTVEEFLTDLYDIPLPVDYNNIDQKNALTDAIMEAHYSLIEGSLD